MAIFGNTARGPMVDYEALARALEGGRLGSAMLETFAVEPAPPDWPLLRLPNVTLTPHVAGAPLPGGEGIEHADFEGFLARLRAGHPWLPEPLARRYARLYGSRTARLLDGARSLGDLGRAFGAGLYEAKARYLIANEWARTAQDVLERRTKLGLRLNEAERSELAAWMPGARRR